MSIPASLLLVYFADGPSATVSGAIYGVTLMTMFGLSATYHRLPLTDVGRRRMQRLDHCGIYLLIAGTYVPIAIVVLPRAWGIPLLVIVAGGATFGAIMKLAAFEHLKWVTYALYPIMGWTAIVATPVLIDSLTGLQVFSIVAGGMLYSVGIPVLFLRRPNPWPLTFGYHEVWHALVTVAATFHFIAVASILT